MHKYYLGIELIYTILTYSKLYLFKVLGEIMTMSEVADLRQHNDHLIMSFVIQAIVNICKANHLIIFL